MKVVRAISVVLIALFLLQLSCKPPDEDCPWYPWPYSHTFIHVANSGMPECDGRYMEYGERNGKKVYTIQAEVNCSISYEPTHGWTLKFNGVNTQILYYSNTHDTLPAPETETQWMVLNGVSPAPTVRSTVESGYTMQPSCL